MSTVLESIETQHVTAGLKAVTQAVLVAGHDLHWRFDLVSSRRYPVQYYATVLRGTGLNADEIVVIGIECFESDERHFIVSATVTGEDGVMLAQSPSTHIVRSPESTNGSARPGEVGDAIEEIQAAFHSLVHWVNAQRDLILNALA